MEFTITMSKAIEIKIDNCNSSTQQQQQHLCGRKNSHLPAMPYATMANCKRIHFAKYNTKLILIITFYLICPSQSILVEEQKASEQESSRLMAISSHNNITLTNISTTSSSNNVKSITINTTNTIGLNPINSSPSVASSAYFDKLDNLERSVAAVLIKVAYGTTSTTKRSIPDNSYILGLTTVATPPLTTLRYPMAHHQPQIISSSRHRNYELDLERDHALPTSAPNADILKSNNNPTYPNPNRHHSSSNNNHDRDRHRHTMQYNSTPAPSFPSLLKKNPAKGQPTIPMYPGDIPSYSPPSRSFFTPPLPHEYQNPFADKPTLRGTNNEGLIAGNSVQYNSRRPIPPPSLMPGHERIPFRPPDLTGDTNVYSNVNYSIHIIDAQKKGNVSTNVDLSGDRKKALNTPSHSGSDEQDIEVETIDINHKVINDRKTSQDINDGNALKRQEVLPNIRRILGSNGKKSDIPAVLLRQVTQRPIVSYHQPPVSAIVAVASNANSDETVKEMNKNDESTSSNINKSKQTDFHVVVVTQHSIDSNISHTGATTPSAAAAIGDVAPTSITSATMQQTKPTITAKDSARKSSQSNDGSAASTAAATTWTWAWHIHIYLSVVLFTILAVYSLYKLLTYNKLTHLFAQSYFVYIHLILIAICIMRIFYLCFDAYNIHGTFHIFVAELLLNLPATFLTVAFSVLILFLFLKSWNHKNNRYSALVRPLTVVVGCGVHVLLCITLHYVESYTLQNHHIYFQQQQQQQYFRRQQQQQQLQQLQLQQQQHDSLTLSSATVASITAASAITMLPATSLANPQTPPRVLSLICQIIYIFICLSLGLLYLYLYGILKRILRSKSQNYIHGYQNLSYAIHITIATALLFVLLATLQIFGVFCISSVRTNLGEVDVDWMQWGYQFSLRLIEIAIITLISWVAGLQHNMNGPNSNAVSTLNGDVHMIGHSTVGANGAGTAIREKHDAAAHQHSNVANFFLPCTSGSSQEQFETDYPTICNANTNLHTYTMRTGKLIYDDSYALHSLAGPGSAAAAEAVGVVTTSPEYQLREPMYQRPYDTGSIRSALNHNMTPAQTSQRYHHHQHQSATYMTSTGYMTDETTDHYENPNFDLLTNSTGMSGRVEVAPAGCVVGVGSCGMKLTKNTVSSGSASVTGSGCGSGSGSGSSGTSQQQMLLMQSDSCYSEPLQENSSYEFHNFERPIFKEESHASDDCWPDRERDLEREKHKRGKSRKQNNVGTLERKAYDNPERRSSNSTNSCSSSSNNGVVISSRYASYNSYERRHHKGVRKSGTLNNIVNGSTTGLMPPKGAAQRRGVIQCGSKLSLNGTQTLTERSPYYQRTAAKQNAGRANDFELAATIASTTTVRDELSIKKHQQEQLQPHYNHHNSDDEAEEEDDDDDMNPGCNVESANLITIDDIGNSITSNTLAIHQQHHQSLVPNASNTKPICHQLQNSLEITELSSNMGSTSGSGIARIHCIHNVHQPSHSIPNAALLQINSNGIDC